MRCAPNGVVPDVVPVENDDPVLADGVIAAVEETLRQGGDVTAGGRIEEGDLDIARVASLHLGVQTATETRRDPVERGGVSRREQHDENHMSDLRVPLRFHSGKRGQCPQALLCGVTGVIAEVCEREHGVG